MHEATWAKTEKYNCTLMITEKLQMMPEERCRNSFIDELEELIKDSKFSSENFTMTDDSFDRLKTFANNAINGKYRLS